MEVLRQETFPLREEPDIVASRQHVRRWAIDIGFALVDQTKLVTAASELARNTIKYGGGGTMQIEALRNGGRRGLRLTFTDQGPGIKDIDMALRDGFSTGNGLGLGLGGAKRLSGEFEIRSAPGEGTTIMIARWT